MRNVEFMQSIYTYQAYKAFTVGHPVVDIWSLCGQYIHTRLIKTAFTAGPVKLCIIEVRKYDSVLSKTCIRLLKCRLSIPKVL